MNRLLDRRTIKIKSSSSPLKFETTGGGSWKVWDRFIAVNGQNIYHIGNICGTCAFFFENLHSRKSSIAQTELVEKLNAGILLIDDNSVDTLKEIVPKGNYEVALLKIKPKLVEIGQLDDYFTKEQVDLWGYDTPENVPFSPKVSYFRGSDTKIKSDSKLFEFFIPLTSPDSVEQKRVDYYHTKIQNGEKPTAVSLTVLDVKEPAMWSDDDVRPEFTSHWCLAHYIIDGHHKLKAASDLNSETTLLSFIALDKGVSSIDDISKMLKILTEQYGT